MMIRTVFYAGLAAGVMFATGCASVSGSGRPAGFQEIVSQAGNKVFPAVVYINAVAGNMKLGREQSNVVAGSGVLINGSSVYFGTIDHQTPDGEGMAIVVDGKASGSAVMYFLQEGTWDQGVLTGEAQLIRGSSQTDPAAGGCVIQCTLDGSADEIMTQAQLTVSQTQNGVTHQFTLQAENGAYSSDGTDLISCALHSDCGVSLLVDGSVTDLTYQNPYPWGKQPRQMGLPFSSYAYGYGGR